MDDELTCGTDDHLRGDRVGEAIRIACGGCDEIHRERRHIRPGEHPAK